MIYCYTGMEWRRVYIEAVSLCEAIGKVHDFFQQDAANDTMLSPFSTSSYLIEREAWELYSPKYQQEMLEEFASELNEFMNEWYLVSNWKECGSIVVDSHY